MKAKTIFSLLLAVFLIFSCQKENSTEPVDENIHPQQDIPWPSLADSPWPMFHHDPQSTGRSPYRGPQLGKIKWKFDVNAPVGNSAVIGPDSTIYFCSSFEELNGSQVAFLYAVTFNGNFKWKLKVHENNFSDPRLSCTPIIANDGTIYVGSSDHLLYAVQPDGSIKWTFKANNRIRLAGITIGIDGVIYFVDWDHYLYAINPDGTLKWMVDGYHLFQESESSGIAFSPDGATLYLGFTGTINSDTTFGLAAVTVDGKIKWIYETGPIYGTPLIDNAGNIFFGAGAPGIIEQKRGYFSITPEGKMRWKYQCYPVGSTDITMDYDGNVYFSMKEAGYWIVSLDNEGNFRWKYDISNFGEGLTSTIICDVEGTIYAACWDHDMLFAINSDGKLKWQLEVGPVAFISPALSQNFMFLGLAYWQNEDKEFVCIQ